MAEYVTSDLHFNHHNIIGYCSRPFTNVDDMHEALIAGWNSVVRDNDIVYLLGDFILGLRPANPARVFGQLRGRKVLIVGNHDVHHGSKTLSLGWEAQHTRLELRRGVRVVMDHYPIESWNGAYAGAVHLHGHSHGGLKRVIPHRFDVGVDTPAGFDPVPKTIDHYIALAAAQDFEAQDGQRRETTNA